jgi:hypothetical protein
MGGGAVSLRIFLILVEVRKEYSTTCSLNVCRGLIRSEVRLHKTDVADLQQM